MLTVEDCKKNKQTKNLIGKMFKGKNLQLVDKFWRLMYNIVIVVNNTAL